MTNKEPELRRRLAKARIRGTWYFITEYQFLPEEAILVELDGQKLLIPKGDWFEVDPKSLNQSKSSRHAYPSEVATHPPSCFCPACRRLRKARKTNQYYSIQDRIEFVMLGIFLAAAVAVCVWGLCAVLALD